MNDPFPSRDVTHLFGHWEHDEERRLNIGLESASQFDELCATTRMVQDHEIVQRFRFVPGSYLQKLPRFPAFTDVRDRLVPASDKQTNRFFVSHRWLSVDHPDPSGDKMKLLKPHLDPDALYWIDFSCLPQQFQTSREVEELRTILSWLPSLIFDTTMLVIRVPNDEYFDRAWCFFETLAANIASKGRTLVATELSIATGAFEYERVILKRLLGGDARLPVHLMVTHLSDLAPLQDATRTLQEFAAVNIASHYMGLGQQISGGLEGSAHGYFYMIHRYYLLATCDFTPMLEWTLDKCSQLDIDFAELARLTEFDDNFFVRMAQRYEFSHHVNVYSLPSVITIDARRLHWLSSHRRLVDSATNLFFILTSLLKPRPKNLKEDPRSLAVQSVREVTQESDRVSSTMVSERSIGDQLTHQRRPDPNRLSVEIDCAPGYPRPGELFDLVVYGTGVHPDDFDVSLPVFGMQEFLVRPDEGAITRYLMARDRIKVRLEECFEKGLVRGASW